MDFTKSCLSNFAGMLATFCCVISIGNQAQASEALTPHRAVYDLYLESVPRTSNIVGVAGRMVYEFRGSQCDGYTVHFRVVTKMEMEDGPPRLMDQNNTIFESGDGRTLRFSSYTYDNQDEIRKVEGIAEKKQDSLMVQLTTPDNESYELDLADFPVKQTINILRHARNNQNFYRSKVYDLSDEANKVSDTTVVIGNKRGPRDQSETGTIAFLDNKMFWPVTVSYFDEQISQDGLPVYRTAFDLYENGITRNLLLDYRTFALRGKLVSLELLKPSKNGARCAQ